MGQLSTLSSETRISVTQSQEHIRQVVELSPVYLAPEFKTS